MAYWLVKSEPVKYSFERLLQEGSTVWDGVRNAQARNNLLAMRHHDPVLYYHSNEGKAIVGLARVASTAPLQDPTTPDPRWQTVELEAVRALPSPITLATLKAHPELAQMALVRQSRLSVMPIHEAHFTLLLQLAGL